MNTGADYKEKSYTHSIKDAEKFGTTGDQYAIVEYGSVYVPGDQRSRDYPGHGYPARNEPTCEFTIYATKEAWEKEIQYRLAQKSYKEWFPLVFRRPTITTTVDIHT